jgi:hypothetical protein
MTAAILEKANDELRAAVKARLEATDPSDEKMIGYQLDQGDTVPSCCEGLRMRGDSLMGRTVVMPAGMQMERVVGSGSPEWLDALERLRALHHEKTAQYGGADDAFENVTASAKCGVEPWRRALCDLSDCVVRMQKYAQGQPVDPTNALLDAANWALICLIKMEEAGRSTTGPIPIMRKVGE